MAVLAELDETDEGVLGGIRNVLSFGKRDAIRKALAARARGDEGPLDEADRKKLDDWVEERAVTEADLLALADRRAESIRAELIDAQDADPSQVSVEPSVVAVDGGNAEVTVEIVSRADDDDLDDDEDTAAP
jgi:hypothetical protein